MISLVCVGGGRYCLSGVEYQVPGLCLQLQYIPLVEKSQLKGFNSSNSNFGAIWVFYQENYNFHQRDFNELHINELAWKSYLELLL